jgi:hypothetical protein
MNDDKSFTQNIQNALDNGIEELDADVSRRLRLARYQALEAYQEKHNYWKPASGFALATMLLVAIGVWQFGGNQRSIEQFNERDTVIAQSIEDLELIASSDSMQFYQDLEFYQWLDVVEGNTG